MLAGISARSPPKAMSIPDIPMMANRLVDGSEGETSNLADRSAWQETWWSPDSVVLNHRTCGGVGGDLGALPVDRHLFSVRRHRRALQVGVLGGEAVDGLRSQLSADRAAVDRHRRVVPMRPDCADQGDGGQADADEEQGTANDRDGPRSSVLDAAITCWARVSERRRFYP